MPRAQHDLLRVLAGGIWLAMGIATAAVFQVAVSMMTGDAERVMAVSLGAYLNLVTGPLTVYLLVSALAVATDHPVRWMFAIIFAVMATGSVCVSTLACATSPLLSAVRGFFGLGEVLGAFIVPDVYRVSPTPAGLGEAVKIVLGLFVGCVAVYGATRLRSR